MHSECSTRYKHTRRWSHPRAGHTQERAKPVTPKDGPHLGWATSMGGSHPSYQGADTLVIAMDGHTHDAHKNTCPGSSPGQFLARLLWMVSLDHLKAPYSFHYFSLPLDIYLFERKIMLRPLNIRYIFSVYLQYTKMQKT